MTTWQSAFWRAFYAWWLDGCPEPRMWWYARMTAEAVGRFELVIGRALLPAMQRSALAMETFAAAVRSAELAE